LFNHIMLIDDNVPINGFFKYYKDNPEEIPTNMISLSDFIC